MFTGRLIILILLGLSITGAMVTGQQLYYRLTYLWALVFVVSWGWSRLVLSGLQLRRVPRSTRAQAGQVFEERFELYNTGRLPRIWVAVRDESPLPGTQGSRLFPAIEGRRGRTYLARTRLLKRGVYPLGPTVMESGDPFGLFPVSRVFPVEDSLLVYPTLAEVSEFPNPAGIMPGGESLRRRTHQVTPNASEVRDYAPGDPLNRIHWLSTARRGRLMSKEFELDPQAEVWIFLDSSRNGQASIPYEQPPAEVEDLFRRKSQMTLPPATEEYGVSIAASLARYYLRRGRSLGFASAGQLMSVIPPDRGGRQLSKILESLALLRAQGSLPLQGLVEVQAQHLTRGSTVVLVTHSVQQEVALTADYLVRRGLRPVVVLIDASSFDGPSGTDELEEMIRFLHIPVRVVRRGDEIGAALSAREMVPVV